MKSFKQRLIENVMTKILNEVDNNVEIKSGMDNIMLIYKINDQKHYYFVSKYCDKEKLKEECNKLKNKLKGQLK